MINRIEYIDTSREEEMKARCYTDRKELLSVKYDESGIKISADGKRLLRCKKNVNNSYVIPQGVEVICDRAFCDVTNVESVVLPETIKYIGERAFDYTTKLKEINFPSSLEYIGEEAFFCSNIKKADLSHTHIKNIKREAFSSCQQLRTIKLPQGLLSIEEMAFDEVCCREFVIPDSVLYIGSGAVSSYYLKELILPSSLKDMGDLYNIETKLKSNSKNIVIVDNVVYNADHTVLYSCLEDKGDFLVPNTVRTIKAGCFKHCAIYGITFEENSVLEEIEDEAFYGFGLRMFRLPSSLKKIGNSAFEGSYLTAIKLPDSLETIGSNAFANCQELTEIGLPNSLKEIGEGVFENDDNLKYIDVAEGQKKRFNNLFPNLKRKIKEREFDESLFKIDDEAEDWEEDDEEWMEEESYQLANIEINNDVNWTLLGLSLDSINIEISNEEEMSVFMEISGKLKEDFMLCGALYDTKGKIRKTSSIEFFSTNNLKYRGNVNTIVSYTFLLNCSITEIQKLRLYI